MDICKYTAYFHDGYLFDIKHIGNKIELFLESSQLESNEIEENMVLSEDNTLKGKLSLIDIKDIKFENEYYYGILKKKHSKGEILDLEIKDNEVFLLIDWIIFPQIPFLNDVSKIEIKAEKIYWENIPNLNY